MAEQDDLLNLLAGRLVNQQQAAPAKTNAAPATPTDDVAGKIAAAIQIAKKERPDLSNVEQYGWLSKLLMSKAQGYTSPAQTIYLNPDQVAGMTPQEVADTLIHEQTHVDQMKKRGSSALKEILREALTSDLPYGQRPDEMEAFQAEKERRYRMGRAQSAVPSFGVPGQFFVPMDQYLPSDTIATKIVGGTIKRKKGSER